MTQGIIPLEVCDERPALRWTDRACRALVQRRLRRLAHGAFSVEEPDGADETFGRAGARSRAHLRILDHRFHRAIVAGGGIGAAEAYVRGWWTAPDLTAVLRLFARNLDAADGLARTSAWLAGAIARLAHRARRNTRGGSLRNIHAHYDLGNEFFALFLDDTLTYSSGIFPRDGATMREASVEKLDRLCRKLDLGPNDHVLEIGTGWGSFALHAAARYGCRVTTTTISREQHRLATERVAAAGLDDRVEVLLRDYRDLEGTYDKLVSIEMIEAVGHDFLPTYFAACGRLLRPGGRFALQAISMDDARYPRYRRTVDFIRHTVFPGSCCPSLGAMQRAWSSASPLRLVHFDDITPHYAETLRRWRSAFTANAHRVRDLGFPESFLRLWTYYLCYCEAGFEERNVTTAQLVLERPARGVIE